MKFLFILIAATLFNVEVSLGCRHVRHVVRSFFRRWHGKKENKLEKRQQEDLLFSFILQQFSQNKLRRGFGVLSAHESFPVYTDEGGCYEEGKSHLYRGPISSTETGLACTDWSKFSASVRLEMKESMQLLAKSKSVKGLFRSKVDKFTEEAIVTISNDTLLEMEKKGLLGHNHCRDPDGLGKPWCFVTTIFQQTIWEPCAVPKCTMCWRMRQRARKFYHIPPLVKFYWVPSCTPDGAFSALQCWGTYCWCSDRKGTVIKGTLSRKSDGIPYCGVNFQMAVPRFTSKRTSSSSFNQEMKFKNMKNKNKKESKSRVGVKKKKISRKKSKRKSFKRQKLKNLASEKRNVFPKGIKNSFGTKNHEKISFRMVNTLYETGSPYNVFHMGKTYMCQIKYVITYVMQCTKSSRKNQQKGIAFKSQASEQCFVKKTRSTSSWRCFRKFGDTKWFGFSLKRSNRTVETKKPEAVYVGENFLCSDINSCKGNDVNKWEVLDQLEIHISRKTVKSLPHICTSSYKNRKLKFYNRVPIKVSQKTRLRGLFPWKPSTTEKRSYLKKSKKF